MQEKIVLGHNQRGLRCYQAMPKKPDLIVVGIHGMQEHALRYEWLAEKFASNNIGFVMFDLRGHGKNILDNKPGFDDGDIFENIVADYKLLISDLKSKHKGVKLVVLGHSFGSFIAQRLVKDNDGAVDKFVICGSSHMKNLLTGAGRVLAGLSRVFVGRESDAKLIEKISIRSYGKDFDDENWLSRDYKVWEDYKNDPLCGCVFPVAFYTSMFKGVRGNYSRLNKKGKNAKIFIIAGTKDPVGNFGTGVEKLANFYKKQGYTVVLKLYEDARHELYNEINKEEVFRDTLEFIKN